MIWGVRVVYIIRGMYVWGGWTDWCLEGRLVFSLSGDSSQSSLAIHLPALLGSHYQYWLKCTYSQTEQLLIVDGREMVTCHESVGEEMAQRDQFDID